MDLLLSPFGQFTLNQKLPSKRRRTLVVSDQVLLAHQIQNIICFRYAHFLKNNVGQPGPIFLLIILIFLVENVLKTEFATVDAEKAQNCVMQKPWRV